MKRRLVLYIDDDGRRHTAVQRRWLLWWIDDLSPAGTQFLIKEYVDWVNEIGRKIGHEQD